jgi:hypothetical protein
MIKKKPIEKVEKELSITPTIQQELDDFGQDITIINGWNFNQKKQVERSILYFNSKFVDGDVDTDGLKLYFFNIIQSACGTTTKAIDIDTKDFVLLTAPGGNPLKTWFYQRDLKNWMKQKEFGKILNRLCRELPVFGSVVLKYVNGDVKFVNLKNFVCEQNADSLNDSNYIIEQHYYTPNEFRSLGEEMGWNNVEKTIDAFRGANSKNTNLASQYIRVFERYGEVYNPKSKEYEYSVCYVADIPLNTKTDPNSAFQTAGADFILKTIKIEKHPYIEFHINKIPGRWLGVGIPEQLSEN